MFGSVVKKVKKGRGATDGIFFQFPQMHVVKKGKPLKNLVVLNNTSLIWVCRGALRLSWEG